MSEEDTLARLRAERVAARQAFATWFAAQPDPGIIDAIGIAGAYRRATGQPIDWHETALVLEQLEQADELTRVNQSRDGHVRYMR